MKKICVLVLVLALIATPQLAQSASAIKTFVDGAQGWPVDAQSTTGPLPPMGVSDSYASVQLDYEVVIAGVPAYSWKNGCGPTAAGMVIGYWDGHGFDDLVAGDAATQTSGVNDMISSTDNYDDYCIPIDYFPNLRLDRSEPPFGDEHDDDCIADFMKTSQSYYQNYYGWSWFSDVGDALYRYVRLVDAHYDATVENVYWASLTWARFRSEIDAGQPVVFLVDTDADGSTDHFVTAIGYGEQYDTPMYACFNTWDLNVHWYEFAGMRNGQPWGIYGATTFMLVPRLPEADIKANSSNGPITISGSTNLSVTLQLNTGDHGGVNADWWVLAKTSMGKWFYYSHTSGIWSRGQIVTHQGPLFDLPYREVLNRTDLPPTTYTFYFGVDTTMNGTMDMDDMICDSVTVEVLPAP
jgi:hypothetical protein